MGKKRFTFLSTAVAAACLAALATPAHAESGVAFKDRQTGLCLDGDAKGNIYTHACGGDNPYQHWVLTPVSATDTFQMRSVKTGLCLSGFGPGRNEVYGVRCNSTEYAQRWQRWYIDDNVSALVNFQNKYALDSDAKGATYVSIFGTGNPYMQWIMQ
ncbi:RICIN domain-containing protein [Streptomyces sp. NBC_01343]|uniref:RICIN domain-containing protein n=1 Tax=Streptomyces sp. NBC_01343 TaxID=2903832 RepID=UPI002E0DE0B8|nr:RICIN domain-containing protein [Streptomyces sp. NBC_01343]